MTTPTYHPEVGSPPTAPPGAWIPQQGPPPPPEHYYGPPIPPKQPKKPFFKRTGVIVTLAAVGALLIGTIIGTAAQQDKQAKAQPAATAPAPAPVTQPPAAAVPTPTPVTPTPTPTPAPTQPATLSDAQLVANWFDSGGLTAMQNFAAVLSGPLDVTDPAFGRQVASKARAVNAVSAPLPPAVGTPLHAAMTHYANAGDAIVNGDLSTASAQLSAGNSDMDTANAALDNVQNAGNTV